MHTCIIRFSNFSFECFISSPYLILDTHMDMTHINGFDAKLTIGRKKRFNFMYESSSC